MVSVSASVKSPAKGPFLRQLLRNAMPQLLFGILFALGAPMFLSTNRELDAGVPEWLCVAIPLVPGLLIVVIGLLRSWQTLRK